MQSFLVPDTSSRALSCVAPASPATRFRSRSRNQSRGRWPGIWRPAPDPIPHALRPWAPYREHPLRRSQRAGGRVTLRCGAGPLAQQPDRSQDGRSRHRIIPCHRPRPTRADSYSCYCEVLLHANADSFPDEASARTLAGKSGALPSALVVREGTGRRAREAAPALLQPALWTRTCVGAHLLSDESTLRRSCQTQTSTACSCPPPPVPAAPALPATAPLGACLWLTTGFSSELICVSSNFGIVHRFGPCALSKLGARLLWSPSVAKATTTAAAAAAPHHQPRDGTQANASQQSIRPHCLHLLLRILWFGLVWSGFCCCDYTRDAQRHAHRLAPAASRRVALDAELPSTPSISRHSPPRRRARPRERNIIIIIILITSSARPRSPVRRPTPRSFMPGGGMSC